MVIVVTADITPPQGDAVRSSAQKTGSRIDQVVVIEEVAASCGEDMNCAGELLADDVGCFDDYDEPNRRIPLCAIA